MGKSSYLQFCQDLPPRYRLEKVLSGGDHAATVRVFDSGLRQDQAIVKIQRLSTEPSSGDVQAGFQRFCTALASVRHPHVATPYTYGVFRSQDGGTFGYTTRPFISGASLGDLASPLGKKALLHVAAQLCHGLHALHTQGLRHYDLKLENVIVRRGSAGRIDELSQCVLIDLTYRDPADHGPVALNDVTLQYVAPELLDGTLGDARTDLYALGVLLYRLATGEFPFAGSSLPQIMRCQRARSFRPLGERASEIDIHLQKLIESLLEPNPENRPISAQAVLARLDAHHRSTPASPVLYEADASWGFVGRDAELATCVDALLDGPGAGCASLEIGGPPGAGVTAFLRELQDRLEARGVAVLTAQPRRLVGRSIPEQLGRPVNTLVRKSGAKDTGTRRQAKTTTDVLDDLFVATQDRRVVLFVDEWQRADASECSFLRRLMLQDKTTIEGPMSRRARCQIVFGAAAGNADQADPHGQVQALFDRRLQLQGLSRAELTQLVAGSPALGLSKVNVGLVELATGGYPGRVVRLLQAVSRQVREGVPAPDALERAVSELGGAYRVDAELQRKKAALQAQPHGNALIALALWQDTLTRPQWEALLSTLAPQAAGRDALDAWVDADSIAGHVRSRHTHLAEVLWRTLEDDQKEALAEGLLRVLRDTWRSSDPRELVPLLRFVARLGRIPPPCYWGVCRALMLLLRHGFLADAESTSSLLATSSDVWWLRLFREAACQESGRIDDARLRLPTDDVVTIPTSEAFYRHWIHARGLRRAQYKREAFSLLKSIAESPHHAVARSAPGLLEDYGRAAAEIGCLDEATHARRDLLRRIARSLSFSRTGAVLRNAWHPLSASARPRDRRRIASYYRIRHRIHVARRQYRRALRVSKRERILNRAARNLMREAACLNDEGVALARSGARAGAVGAFERCAALRETLDDERGLVIALNNLAGALSGVGRFGSAAAVLNRARIIATRNGLSRHRDLSMLRLGNAYVKRGQLRDARKVFRRVMRFGLEDGSADISAGAMFNCASAAIDLWHPVVAEGYAEKLRRLAEAHPECPLEADPDLLEAELALRAADLDRLEVVVARLRRKRAGLARDLEYLLAANRGELGREPAAERVQPLTTRIRLVIRRWRLCQRQVRLHSLHRMLKLCEREGLTRERLECLAAHLAFAREDVEASLAFGLEALSYFEFREGHDDLQIEIRVRLADLLQHRARHAEAWRLLEDALLRFRTLERKLSKWRGEKSVLTRLHGLLRAAIRGERPESVRHRITESLSADAFDALISMRRGGGLRADENQRALLKLGAALAGDNGSDGVLDDLLRITVDTTGAQRAILVIGDSASRHIHRTWLQDGVETERGEISWAVVSQVLVSGQPAFYSDALTSEELASHRSIAVLRLRSLACVPVRAGQRVLGALYLDHHGIAGLFSEEQLGFLDLVAGLMASTLRVTEIESKVSRYRQELDETQEHVMRAERNRVAGEIASGLVHDFKNVLAAVVARSQMLRLSDVGESVRNQAKAIEHAAQTGSNLIQRLQECSREHASQAEELVNILHVASEALDLLGPRLSRTPSRGGSSINASVKGSQSALVWGVPGELREMFLNLIVNACDAMRDGGSLCISVDVDEGAQEATIVVRDTGSGMAADARARAFDPFFTTKGKAGTGLGLVVVRNTVVRYGGSIEMDSEEGVGTTFTIHLPLSTGRGQRARAGAARA